MRCGCPNDVIGQSRSPIRAKSFLEEFPGVGDLGTLVCRNDSP